MKTSKTLTLRRCFLPAHFYAWAQAQEAMERPVPDAQMLEAYRTATARTLAEGRPYYGLSLTRPTGVIA